MADSKRTDRRTLAIAGLVLLAILLVSVNALSNRLFRGVALDLTQDKLFTLSDGTKEVLSSLKEPVTLRFYYSKKLGEAAPSFVPFITRVREMLERYRDLSGGKLRLEIYNPEPFSVLEDRAVGAGLRGIPLSRTTGERAFFGLVGTNTTDDREVVPIFSQQRARFLEYDLTRIIARLGNPKRKVIGLMTNLPLSSRGRGPAGFGRPWVVITQLGQRFEVRQVTAGVEKIDEDIDVLMVVHPKNMQDKALYAIDQYVLGGGKAVFFVDPHAETAGIGQRSPLARLNSGSELPKLLEAWGIEIAKDRVVGDARNAVRVSAQAPDGRQLQGIPYLAWIQLDRTSGRGADGKTVEVINRTDVVTADLRRIYMASPGAIQKRKDAKIEIVPLLQSSGESMLIDAMKLRFRPDLEKLVSEFKSGEKPLVMAARLKGTVKSAFPDGPPKDPKKKDAKEGDKTPDPKKADAKKDGEKKADAKKDEKKPAHLKASKGPINVVVIADTDMLDDRFWISQGSSFGQNVAVAVADNGAFVLNIVDNLAGGRGLIGLRSRGTVERPFTLVKEIEAEANRTLQAKEKALVEKLKDTQKKLTDLQTKANANNKTILSKEQEKTIAQFRAEVLEVRKELRAVQLAKRQDIDRLETRLQFFTIGAVPILIGILAVLLGLVRQIRRRRRHAAA